MSIESMMPSNHLFLCFPLLLLPSIFPRITRVVTAPCKWQNQTPNLISLTTLSIFQCRCPTVHQLIMTNFSLGESWHSNLNHWLDLASYHTQTQSFFTCVNYPKGLLSQLISNALCRQKLSEGQNHFSSSSNETYFKGAKRWWVLFSLYDLTGTE